MLLILINITNFSISSATITKKEYNLNSNNVHEVDAAGVATLTTFQTYIGKYYNDSDEEVGNGEATNGTKIKFEDNNLVGGLVKLFDSTKNGVFGYEFSDFIIIHVFLVASLFKGNIYLNFNVAKDTKNTQVVIHLPRLSTFPAFNVVGLNVTGYNQGSTYKTYRNTIFVVSISFSI